MPSTTTYTNADFHAEVAVVMDSPRICRVATALRAEYDGAEQTGFATPLAEELAAALSVDVTAVLTAGLRLAGLDED